MVENRLQLFKSRAMNGLMVIFLSLQIDILFLFEMKISIFFIELKKKQTKSKSIIQNFKVYFSQLDNQSNFTLLCTYTVHNTTMTNRVCVCVCAVVSAYSCVRECPCMHFQTRICIHTSMLYYYMS